jgi:hypothetical protein
MLADVTKQLYEPAFAAVRPGTVSVAPTNEEMPGPLHVKVGLVAVEVAVKESVPPKHWLTLPVIVGAGGASGIMLHL